MKFVHFGCWNNIKCQDLSEPNYRDIVLDYIRQYEKDSEFIIVSGDNWYNQKSVDPLEPDDKTKYKFYFTNILSSGLYKLYDIGKPCYMILGNHDESADQVPLEIKKDCMVNTLKYYISRINSGQMDIKTPTLQELAHFAASKRSKSSKSKDSKSKSKGTKSTKENRTPNTPSSPGTKLVLFKSKDEIEYINYEAEKIIIVFINTNILEHNNQETVQSYLTDLQALLSKHPDKLKLVVGHNQILSQSTSKIKTLCKNQSIIKQFINILSPHRAVYLCADTHNFQISKIEDIVQILVGTGGALPDTINTPDNKVRKVHFDYSVDKAYTVDGFYHNSYGYSVIDITDDNSIRVSYKHILDTDGAPVFKEYVYLVDQNHNITQQHHAVNIDVINESILEASKASKASICTDLDASNLVINTSPNIKGSEKYCYRAQK
jgi:virulence-associated protein VapD